MSELRTKFKLRRRQLSMAEMTTASNAICERLLSHISTNIIDNIALYFSSENEPDITRLLSELEFRNCQLFAPKSTPNPNEPYSVAPIGGPYGFTMQPGRFGIAEPVSPPLPLNDAKTRVECWLVPGIAFTRSGARIGQGRGFYDRLLANAPGLKIGIAYDWQLVPTLKQLPHDVRMDFIATPSELIRCH